MEVIVDTVPAEFKIKDLPDQISPKRDRLYIELITNRIAKIIRREMTNISHYERDIIAQFQFDIETLSLDFVRTVSETAPGEYGAREAGGLSEYGMLAPFDASAIPPFDPEGDVEGWAGRVAGPTYLEENLKIPRSTLHRWFRCNEVVALRRGRRRHVFPLSQFVDGRPAAGIGEVLSCISNHRQAWFWMVHPSDVLEGRLPIELLRQDMVADVISAAYEYGKAIKCDAMNVTAE